MTNTYDTMLEEFDKLFVDKKYEMWNEKADPIMVRAWIGWTIEKTLSSSHLQILQQQREEIEGMRKALEGDYKSHERAWHYNLALNDILSFNSQEIQSVKELLTKQGALKETP